MRNKILALCGVAVLGLFGAMMLISPVQAETLPTEPWQALNTGVAEGETGWTPDAPQVDSTLSRILDPVTAHLEWVDGDDTSELGTSLETGNLGLEVNAATEVTVQYVASDDKACDNGAVRAFTSFGTREEVNTGTASLYQSVANCSADGGTIQFTITEAGTLGYTGLVFDTSNNGVVGTVVFSNLTIGEELVLFTPRPEPTPTATVSASPTTKPVTCDEFSTQDEAQVAYEAGATQLDGNGDGVACESLPAADEDQLPTTGSPLTWIVVIGVALLLGGGTLFALSRLRRQTQ